MKMGLNDEGEVDRREFGFDVAAKGLAASLFSTFFGTQKALAEEESALSPKTIIITGANSGVGLAGGKKLAARGHAVYVACRTQAKADRAAQEIGAAGAFECDLSSLESVRGFAAAWAAQQGGRPVDALCLNAGMAPNTKQPAAKYTAQGFEETIGVNHLGHFLLASLLIKNLESSKQANPRLVVTASSVHDPDQPGGDVGSKAALGDLLGLEGYFQKGTFDMVDGGAFDGDKAYKDSKLCNVLFTTEMQRRLAAKGSKVTCNCFSPGLIPTSGLFRNQNPLFSGAFGLITGAVGVAATVEQGGDCLAYLVDAPELEGQGGLFLTTQPGKPKSDFGPFPISKEASDVSKAKSLFELSTKLVKDFA
uniref:protochlorophyllide reductase n=1 Tax=Heterosigma akashiwo TaxID=2829 RepID=A0A7S3YA04_HETAK